MPLILGLAKILTLAVSRGMSPDTYIFLNLTTLILIYYKIKSKNLIVNKPIDSIIYPMFYRVETIICITINS